MVKGGNNSENLWCRDGHVGYECGMEPEYPVCYDQICLPDGDRILSLGR